MFTDVISSFSRHGFERIYFLTGHGGNIATITAAFSEIYAELCSGAPRLKLQNWFLGPRMRKLLKELYGDSEGSHATPSEISFAWQTDL